ncbi:MAG: Gfo/Idh/MocA family protein [Opitutaceae bacterium]
MSSVRQHFPGSALSAAMMMFAGAAPCALLGAAAESDVRIGMIGLDTSHVIAFTKLLNDPAAEDHVEGGRVVAGYKGGSPEVEQSASRVDRFTRELVTTYGVKLCDSIEELARNVDAIMIESVDGRAHLEQARRVFPFRKPVFIDKPLAGSLRDGIEIFRFAEQHECPVFSSSSLRFSDGMEQLRQAEIGERRGAFSLGPATLEPHHPDLFWYGIHAVEALYTVMGPGCEQVTRTHTADTDVVTGVWADERVGTMRGQRGTGYYALLVFGSKGIAQYERTRGYAPMLREIITFFRTGVPPVEPAETIEILAFMEAADESKRRGGRPVSLAETIAANGGPLIK